MSRRVNIAAREKIIATAYRLFADEGYEAISVERVADAVGMKKATVFYYYPSKSDLGQAVMETAARRHVAAMRAVFAEVDLDPVEVVRALFDGVRKSRQSDCGKGCFIGRMGQEIDERHAAMRREVAGCVREWRREASAYLRGWQRRGYFQRGFQPEATADAILSLYEGGVLIGRIVGETAPVTRARSAAVHLVLSWRG